MGNFTTNSYTPEQVAYILKKQEEYAQKELYITGDSDDGMLLSGQTFLKILDHNAETLGKNSIDDAGD